MEKRAFSPFAVSGTSRGTSSGVESPSTLAWTVPAGPVRGRREENNSSPPLLVLSNGMPCFLACPPIPPAAPRGLSHTRLQRLVVVSASPAGSTEVTEKDSRGSGSGNSITSGEPRFLIKHERSFFSLTAAPPTTANITATPSTADCRDERRFLSGLNLSVFAFANISLLFGIALICAGQLAGKSATDASNGERQSSEVVDAEFARAAASQGSVAGDDGSRDDAVTMQTESFCFLPRSAMARCKGVSNAKVLYIHNHVYTRVYN